jgi:hypothetical protein
MVNSVLPHDILQAALLFGSSARGDAREDSDTDLLLVVRDEPALLPLRELLRDARRGGQVTRLSIASHTWSSLKDLGHDDWSFVEHLLHEGIVLFDPHEQLLSSLSRKRPSSPAISREIRTRSAGLSRYEDLSRFSGDYFFPLLGIYGVAKQIAILATAQAGVPEFRRGPAFLLACELHPRCGDALAHLQSLSCLYRPNSELSHCSHRPPLDDVGFVGASLDAVGALVDEMA